MKKIGVISDTHSFWDDSFDKYFSNCDEIWHAGDIGNLKITDKLGEDIELSASKFTVFEEAMRKEIDDKIKEELKIERRKV